MNRHVLYQQVTWAMLITPLLAGCGAPLAVSFTPTTAPLSSTATATPILQTATPTPKVPTATSTQEITLATTADEIIGTWMAPGNYYIRFDPDGTFRNAHALDKLDSQPFAISSYEFEGTSFITTEIKVSGVRTCGKKLGSYEIWLLDNGNIRIVTIKEQCAQRAIEIAREYEPVH